MFFSTISRNKTSISISLLLTLLFLWVTLMMGWHIHHACSEGIHGFETHTATTTDTNCGDECGAESLLSHTFEQGALLAHNVNLQTPAFINFEILLLGCVLLLLIKLTIITTPVLSTSSPPGFSRYFHTSFSLRAPPLV